VRLVLQHDYTATGELRFARRRVVGRLILPNELIKKFGNNWPLRLVINQERIVARS
jgi:hypothetical protein